MKQIFNDIYLNNKWNCNESRSGKGSTKKYTKDLVPRLSSLIKKYNIKTMFDAPCGDLNWVLDVEIDNYIGGDISSKVIEEALTKNPNVFEFDIITDKFPEADLWLCRDCLNHLPDLAISRVFENFDKSNIKYALISNHCGAEYQDLEEIGKYREIDFIAAPWHLGYRYNYLECIIDTIGGFPDRELILLEK